MKPLVSICIPTYNGEKYIIQAMDSAISQTYTNLEVIVSDDASSDETLKIIESYKDKTNVPIYIFKHKPKGIGANWNHCVQKANGNYIKFLFQDDVLMPNCIEEMIKLAIKNNKVGLVYCKRKIIFDKETKNTNNWIKKFSNLHKSWDSLNIKQDIISGKTYLKDAMLLDSPINKIGEPSAVLLHKNVFKKVGFFNIQLKQALDVEYWYRLMPYFNIAFLDKELVSFRLHENQASQINSKTKTIDKTLLPKLFIKNIYRYLHPNQKKKLRAKVYKNSLFYKSYKRIKARIKKTLNKNG